MNMKAVYQTVYGASDVLKVGEVARPTEAPAGHLLVKVAYTSANPIDYKVREGMMQAPISEENPLIVGWDVAGQVVSVGADVTDFAAGDAVFFAGDITKPGSYAEYAVVDARLVAKKPTSMGFEDAAALPLTALTAHETLVEKMRLDENSAEKSLLIVNGAGGVGSVAIQYAKKCLGVGTVIATASRPETVQWCKSLGADHVINHHEDLLTQLQAIGVPAVDAVAVYHDAGVLGKVMNLLACDGHVAVVLPIVPACLENLDVVGAFFKRVSIHMDCMFSRSMHSCKPEKQGAVLAQIAHLVDSGKIVTTRTKTLPLEQVAAAHDELSSGKTIGKIVLKVSDQ
ncbi:MAG: hypothetical protein MHM6MM_000515 [Cercozoa sp. M6MM]